MTKIFSRNVPDFLQLTFINVNRYARPRLVVQSLLFYFRGSFFRFSKVGIVLSAYLEVVEVTDQSNSELKALH